MTDITDKINCVNGPIAANRMVESTSIPPRPSFMTRPEKDGPTPPLILTSEEQALLNGDGGQALQFAMQLVVRAAEIMAAPRLLETGFVHIDACHYYGRAHLDFARFLLERGAQFDIPAWTNTIPVSLIQEEVRPDANATALVEARELAELYLALGASPVWTCAPYQLPDGPAFGQHIVVGESNAVAYFNSAIGARTNKYGDFLDVACGLTRRVPMAGLHTDAGRRAEIQIDLSEIPEPLRETELLCHVLGYQIGRLAGSQVPVITGLPADTPVDSLKALSAAAAASGGVSLFHVVGVTPEAPTVEAALQGRPPKKLVQLTTDHLAQARDSLSTVGEGKLNMVALGTPHFSFTEFERLVAHFDGRKVHPDVILYISTSRHVAAQIAERGWDRDLERAGAKVLVDTCTYFGPAVQGCRGRVMTNSAKWAYYAPGMLLVDVAFGGLKDCVDSAVKGEVTRDSALWSPKLWGTAP